MTPPLTTIDHIHVHVADRRAAEAWYAQVLGLRRMDALAFWAEDGGPLTLANPEGTVHLALFERPADMRATTVAFGVSGDALCTWQAQLQTLLGGRIPLVDHQVSWSLYFKDPDGNSYEITSYDYETVARRTLPATLESADDP